MSILIILLIALAVLAIYLFMTCAQRMPDDGKWLKDYKYAHRGLHDPSRPENTLAAFTAAMEKGYGIELDIHLSSDGELIVFHDNTLDRITGMTGKVEDYSAAQLTQMAVCGTGHTIPTLKEVLAAVGGRVPLLIETKNEGGAGPLEVRLSALMKDYDGHFAVQSFSPFSIGWFAKNDPGVLRGQLSSRFHEGAEHIAPIKRFVIRHMLTNFLAKPQFVSYETDGISSSIIRRMRRCGLYSLVWVVRSAKTQAATAKYVDTIIFEDYTP